MNPSQSILLAGAGQRPQKLYRYSQRPLLERSLQLGEFRLCQAEPVSAAANNYLVLSLSSAWDENLFDAGADCCLEIHEAEEFGERIHRAVQRLLPSWVGIDAAVSYGAPSPLGAAFCKSPRYAREKEWLFAWRPSQPNLACNPVTITIGSIANIAELRYKQM